MRTIKMHCLIFVLVFFLFNVCFIAGPMPGIHPPAPILFPVMPPFHFLP